ncbi:phage tail protein [Streptomyces sp. NPDC005962]|uniref:phage tail protein n=1 Tax=Streptomyces sp. NPDC005962 TaxID=3154466 RepID=UPI0033ED31F6
MRGALEGLESPHPLGERLPSVFADDDFAQRFTGGLDALLAPLLNVLDCLDSYFSPALAPEDFVDWLAGWVGAELTGDESEALLRHTVATAVDLHRRRGTRSGLRDAVQAAFNVPPEITESGGASWSPRPLGPFPGDPRPGVHVVLRVPDPDAVDVRRLDDLVAAARPAHLPYTVRVERTASTERNTPS